jgi:hypothetical protein
MIAKGFPRRRGKTLRDHGWAVCAPAAIEASGVAGSHASHPRHLTWMNVDDEEVRLP